MIDEVLVYDRALNDSEVAALAPPVQAPDGPILHYDMENLTADGRMKDLSGNGNDGSFWGSPSPPIVEGRFGLARSFAQPGRIHVGDNGIQTGLAYTGGDMSFGAWVRMNASETDGGYILSKPWNGNGAYNWQLYITPGNQPQIRLYGNTWWESPLGTALVPGQITHLFVVVKNDRSVRLYRNGQIDIRTTHTLTSWSPPYNGFASANLPLVIGTLYPYGTDPPVHSFFSFDGMIDEVLVYDRALNDSEVAALAEHGSSSIFDLAHSISQRGDTAKIGIPLLPHLEEDQSVPQSLAVPVFQTSMLKGVYQVTAGWTETTLAVALTFSRLMVGAWIPGVSVSFRIFRHEQHPSSFTVFEIERAGRAW